MWMWPISSYSESIANTLPACVQAQSSVDVFNADTISL